MNTIWTIGHSTRPLEQFIKILQVYGIQLLVDIRSYPGSRRFPHFNKEQLSKALHAYGIDYRHMPALGGRQGDVSSTRGAMFKTYVSYMQTEAFKVATIELMEPAKQSNTAYMCAEAKWTECHRSMVSDFFAGHGWKVIHILDETIAEDHPLKPQDTQGKLF